MFNEIANDIKSSFTRDNNWVIRIIFINIGVFLACNIIKFISPAIYQFILQWTGLQSNGISFLLKPWTFVTYMFLHGNLFHILFNMYIFWWISRLFREYLPQRHLLSIYFLGGISGGVLFILLSKLFPALLGILIGASAGVMALVIATATYLPNYPLHLLILGEIKLKYLALGILITSSLIDLANNTGGKISHLGGGLLGYLYMISLQKSRGKTFFIDSLLQKWNASRLFSKKSNLKVEYKRPLSNDQYNALKLNKQKVIDEILDKISKSGYDSLTKQEKELLFKMSKEDK